MFDELIQPVLSTSNGRKLGWLVTLVMSFLILWSTIGMLGDISQDLSSSPKQESKIRIATDTSSQLLAELPNEHLFGQALTESDALPITSLQLKLTGVIEVGKSNLSKAIISESGKPGVVYAIGDSLPSGIKVYAVTKDAVVLERGGHLEKLPLAREPLIFQGMPNHL